VHYPNDSTHEALWRVACRSGSAKQVNLAQLQLSILQHMKFRISFALTFPEFCDEAYVLNPEVDLGHYLGSRVICIHFLADISDLYLHI
jgi:hypothetical protein